MLNKVLLIGNLTRDPELKQTNSGLQIAAFGLAVNRVWTDRNSGEKKEDTMFIDISVFGRAAETAHQYLHKGSRALIEGRLKLDQWTDQNGQKRSKHSVDADNVTFLDRKGDRENSGGDHEYAPAAPRYSEPKAAYNPPANPKPAPDIQVESGDDIPF